MTKATTKGTNAMTRTSLAALSAVVLLAASSGALAEESSPATTVLDFESSEPGGVAGGFTTALTGGGGPAQWIVEEDASAPSGRKVLVQKSADKTGSRFPLCIYDAVTASDVDVSVKFKPISGAVDQAGGLVWRYQNPETYYLVRANALEGNVVLYKVEGGKRSDLKPAGTGLLTYGKKAAVAQGRWQTLKVEVRGPRFAVSLNGEHLFDVEDSTFQAPGKVGLWTKADSVTAFDDLSVSRAPSTTATAHPGQAQEKP